MGCDTIVTSIKYSLSLLLLILLPLAQAEENFQFTPLLGFNGRSLYRGVLIWDRPVAVAAVGVSYRNWISLGEGGLAITPIGGPAQTQQLSLALSYWDDKRPNFPALRVGGEDPGFQSYRRSSLNWMVTHQFKGRWVTTKVMVSKNSKVQGSYYLFADLGLKLLPLTTVGGQVAYGDQVNNRYLYGPSARSGLAHVGQYVSLFLPILPGGGRLVAKVERQEIVLNENRRADYVRSGQRVTNCSAMMMWSI